MTDKQIMNHCNTCDVEPPAMKFKCPKCEHKDSEMEFAIKIAELINNAKVLKAEKEKELELLNVMIESNAIGEKQLFEKIGRLETENSMLKEEIIKGGGSLSDKIRAAVFTDLENENKDYKQRLLNIKQILTEGVCKNCSEDSANNCIPECDTQKILQIISEVEDAK